MKLDACPDIVYPYSVDYTFAGAPVKWILAAAGLPVRSRRAAGAASIPRGSVVPDPQPPHLEREGQGGRAHTLGTQEWLEENDPEFHPAG